MEYLISVYMRPLCGFPMRTFMCSFALSKFFRFFFNWLKKVFLEVRKLISSMDVDLQNKFIVL